jgi:Arc/MetJ-type ribon-helix-helix transcriptional regulator
LKLLRGVKDILQKLIVARACFDFYFSNMSNVTVSLPDALDAQIEHRFRAGGFRSKEEYLLALARADCEQSELEMVLEERSKGPFAPLEADWKERVRQAAKNRD